MIARALACALFLLGLYGLVARRNLIKKAFALAVQNTAIVVLFVLEGSRIGSAAPLPGAEGASMVDPLPQALVLTAIVVGVCVSALALALAYRLHRTYGTLDAGEIAKKAKHG